MSLNTAGILSKVIGAAIGQTAPTSGDKPAADKKAGQQSDDSKDTGKKLDPDNVVFANKDAAGEAAQTRADTSRLTQFMQQGAQFGAQAGGAIAGAPGAALGGLLGAGLGAGAGSKKGGGLFDGLFGKGGSGGGSSSSSSGSSGSGGSGCSTCGGGNTAEWNDTGAVDPRELKNFSSKDTGNRVKPIETVAEYEKILNVTSRQNPNKLYFMSASDKGCTLCPKYSAAMEKIVKGFDPKYIEARKFTGDAINNGNPHVLDTHLNPPGYPNTRVIQNGKVIVSWTNNLGDLAQRMNSAVSEAQEQTESQTPALPEAIEMPIPLDEGVSPGAQSEGPPITETEE